MFFSEGEGDDHRHRMPVSPPRPMSFSPLLLGGVVPEVALGTLATEETLRPQHTELGRNRPALETKGAHDVTTTRARVGIHVVDDTTGGHAALPGRTGLFFGVARTEELPKITDGEIVEGVEQQRTVISLQFLQQVANLGLRRQTSLESVDDDTVSNFFLLLTKIVLKNPFDAQFVPL